MRHLASLLLLLALLLAGCGAPARPARSDNIAAAGATTPPRADGPSITPAPPLPDTFPALAGGRPYAYVVDYGRTIRIVDPRTATVVGELPVGQTALPIFAPDGARLYVTHYGQLMGGQGARLDIFEVATGRPIAAAEGLELMAYKIWGPPIVAPARDGRTVYLHGRRIAGENGRDTCWIYTFEVATSQLAPDTIPLPECHVAPLILSADGRTLYSGGWLIDLTTQPATVRENRALLQRALVQSPDGRWIYALDRGGNIAVWDADARREVRTLAHAVPGYGSFVYLVHESVQPSPDGSRLHIATDDGDQREHSFKGIVTLDAATGQTLGTMRAERPFRSFVPSADGREYCLIAEHRPAPQTLDVTLEFWDIAGGARRASVGGIGGDAGPVLAPPPP